MRIAFINGESDGFRENNSLLALIVLFARRFERGAKKPTRVPDEFQSS
jgi:hypothetical protein